MIVDLVDKLIDRCIQLVKEHDAASQKKFDTLIKPVYEQFTKVHLEYLEAFKKYRDLLQLPGGIRLMEAQLKKDNLFSDYQRTKTIVMLNGLTSQKYADFIYWIACYLTNIHTANDGQEAAKVLTALSPAFPLSDLRSSLKCDQRWRKSLLEYIQKHGAKSTTLEIDMIIRLMNGHAMNVDFYYEELRKETVT